MPGAHASFVFLSCSAEEAARLAPPIQALFQYLRAPIEVSLRLIVPRMYIPALGFTWYQNRPLAFTMVPPVVGEAVDMKSLDSETREPVQTVLKDPEFALALVASRELQRPVYLLGWSETLNSSTAVAFNFGTVVSGMVVAPAGTRAAFAFAAGRILPVAPPPPPHESLGAAIFTLKAGLPTTPGEIVKAYAVPPCEAHSYLMIRSRNPVVPPLYSRLEAQPQQ